MKASVVKIFSAIVSILVMYCLNNYICTVYLLMLLTEMYQWIVVSAVTISVCFTLFPGRIGQHLVFQRERGPTFRDDVPATITA